MYGITDDFEIRVRRAWAWLKKQPQFYRARIADKEYKGKTEEILDKLGIIYNFCKFMKMDLLSDEMQKHYLYDSIAMTNAAAINAALDVSARKKLAKEMQAEAKAAAETKMVGQMAEKVANRMAGEAGATVDDLTVKKPSLEDSPLISINS